MKKSTAELWDDLKEFDTCMLVTRDRRGLRSRPMKPHFAEAGGVIRFLTPVKADKVSQIGFCSAANIVFSSPDDGMWISVSGRMRVSDDSDDIEALWSPEAETWCVAGRQGAVVLILEAETAEYWDYSESRLQASWAMLESIASCKKQDAAENLRLTL